MPKGAFIELRRAAEQTPERRERHVDLIRAMAICAVVLGHWLVIAVTETNGEIDGTNALEELPWAHLLTWLLQVMPLFFFIGGYANAASFESHRREDGDDLGWILGRYDRLLRPATALLVVLVVAVGAARLLGVDHEAAATGAWLATVPMWFLLAYLAVVAVAPLAMAAHRRWGLAVPVALAVMVGAGDLARLELEVPWIGHFNYLAAWAAIHQIGFAWRDGRLAARPTVGVPLAVGGLGALVLLTVPGPYPVSMVAVPGDDVQNTAPPTLALLTLAVAQIGLALSLRDRSSRWLQRKGAWLPVVGVNSVILTIFLWHTAAAIVAAIALYGGGIMPVVAVGSIEWFLLRIPWLVACLLILVGFVVIFARIELAVPGARKGARVGRGFVSWIVTAGIATILAGMLGIATAGPGEHGPLGLPTAALLGYAAGIAFLAAASRRVA